MNKVFTVLIFLLFAGTYSFAQLGIGTTTPDSSAILDLSSTSKGLLLPRMTESQRNQIKKPATGLMVYQTGDSTYYQYNGKAWIPVNNSWLVNGNKNATADQFIGTLNDRALKFKVRNEPSGVIDGRNNVTAFGYKALAADPGRKENTAIGAEAMMKNIQGSRNTALGFQSLSNNTDGEDNTALGLGSLVDNTRGHANTAVGMYALRANDNGRYNTAIGTSSMEKGSEGNNNTAIGYRALGVNEGSYNTFIGSDTRSAIRNLTNASAIGAKSSVECNNCMVLGAVGGENGASTSVNVGIGTSLPSNTLHVKGNNADFISTFENNNTSNGDGIKIKLGKTHPMWNGDWVSAVNYPAQNFQGQIDVIRGWIIDHNSFTMQDLATLAPSSLMTGTVISIANKVTEKINTAMGLPRRIGPYSTPSQHIWNENVLFNGLSIPYVGSVPRLAIPALTIPSVEVVPSTIAMPAFPLLPNVFPTLDLKIPNLEATDVTNSLTKENEFLRFVDKDDRMLGSIRAQSINDFGEDYYDGVYFVNVMASLVGIDLVSGFMGGIAEFTNLIDDYNNIGVEYSSGHGDYAEWLPRENPAELITSGDIVGIKGGKITKDLTNAEQVMAVSYRPIMLGNAPTTEEAQLGNKIAFLGQIPVKVMGPVTMGDFIVAGNEIPGYGVAINPAYITPENLRHAVGRSWETNTAAGPKMINTLIGIQNGDYLNILKRSEDKIKSVEERLQALEAKINNGNKTKN